MAHLSQNDDFLFAVFTTQFLEFLTHIPNLVMNIGRGGEIKVPRLKALHCRLEVLMSAKTATYYTATSPQKRAGKICFDHRFEYNLMSSLKFLTKKLSILENPFFLTFF